MCLGSGEIFWGEWAVEKKEIADMILPAGKRREKMKLFIKKAERDFSYGVDIMK